jgi:4-alpha-glucanotransferase
VSDAPARRRLELVRRALTLLGKKKLLLSIHDPSFPGDADEDLGRGSPYSRAGRRFLEFARDLGFTGIQLGPQGQTSRGNPSPYDGTVFSRNSLSIDLASLAGRKQWSGLLSGEELAEELSRRSSRDRARVRHVEAFDAHRRLLWKAYDRFATRDPSTPELAEFTRRNRHWLEADSLYEALSAAHGSEDWRSWPEKGSPSLDRRVFQPGPGEKEPCRLRRREAAAIHARAVVFYRFCQFVAHRQHEHLRETAGAVR